MRKAKRGHAAPALEQVAGNGLLHRRALLAVERCIIRNGRWPAQ